jgi:vitamin B12 transporter
MMKRICVALSALAATSAAAQEHRDTVRTPAVIVSATKTSSPASPHLVTATVLAGEDLQSRGIWSVAQALVEVAGLTVVQAGGSGAQAAVFVRGGQSNYVKVLVDGVPVNEAGGYLDWANLTLDNVDRIEVIRGPSSVLHGSDGVSGVVQIFTRMKERSPALRGAVRLSSQQRQLGRFDTGDVGERSSYGREFQLEGGAGSERLSFTGSAARRDDDGTLRFNNEHRLSAGSAAVQARPGAGTTIRLTARRSNGRYNYPTDFTGAATDSNAMRIERRTVLSAQMDRRMGDRAELALLAGLHRVGDLSSDLPDNSADTVGFYAEVHGRRLRRTLEGRLNFAFSPRTVTTLGVDHSAQHERSSGWSRFGSFPADTTTFDERRNNVGLFAQLLGSSPEGVLYLVGARRDRNEKFGSFDTWRASLSVPLSEDTRLRGSVGTSFKEPAFHEVFPTAYSSGNPALRPERSTAWEVGVERTIPLGTVHATYFDQRFRDMVQWNPGGGAAEPDYFNIGRALARGWELEVRTAESGGVQTWLAYTRAETRVLDAGFQEGAGATFVVGEPLLRRPETTVSAGTAWRTAGMTRIVVSGVYVGARPDRNFNSSPTEPVELDAYTTFQLSAEVPIGAAAARPFLLILRADNVTNTRIEPVFGYVGPGRVLSAGGRFVLR